MLLLLTSKVIYYSSDVGQSMTDRAKTIPSSSDQPSKEMKHVTAALVANGYPKRFVIDVSKPKRPSQQLSTTAPDAARGFCILPYIKGTTEPIKRVLSNYNIKVAQKPHQTSSRISPPIVCSIVQIYTVHVVVCF